MKMLVNQHDQIKRLDAWNVDTDILVKDVECCSCIMMGRHEWGNLAMHQLADAWFKWHQDERFVLVHEHAGWYLGFRRDGSIFATANDMAPPDGGPRPYYCYATCIRRDFGDEHPALPLISDEYTEDLCANSTEGSIAVAA